jgi:molecular chaperone DnaK (HSP70)
MRFCLLIGTLLAAQLASADILSIDLGSQFFKVALVARGKFDIVPNLQSKRKTPTAMSTKAKIREFGDDALLAQAKSPSKVATSFRWLVGANVSSTPASTLYPSEFATPFTVSVDGDRQSALYGNEDFGNRPMEEVLANLFWYAKSLVEEHDTPAAGKRKEGSLKDVVVTVPSWATRGERQAVIDAANIAGFTRVSLVHETSAGSVQRALVMNATTPTNTLFFNLGSGHFESCVIQYGLVGKGSLETPTARVMGCAHSLKAGGAEITAYLARLGAKSFTEKYKKADLSSDPAAMVRLFRQADNVKQTLSANKEGLFSVESLWDEKDMKIQITRADIEKASEGVLAEIDRVVGQTLTRCNLTKSDIHQVEVLGGAWRVPHIQAKLEELVAPLPLGQHLNGDEAMVFGAAFIAANNSQSFRVPKVIFTDVSENEYSIQITPKNIPTGDDAKWPRTQSIFPVGQKLGASKAIKVSVNSELDVSVFENGNLIERLEVRGSRNESSDETPQIVLKVKLDPNGIFEFSGAEAIHERMEEQTLKVPLNTTNERNETEYNVTTITVLKKVKINLEISIEFQAKPLSMTAEQIKAARAALKAVVETENAIKLRTKTKNDLEALVYAMYDKMEDSDEVKKHSSPEERAAVVAAAKAAEEWLDENSYSATVDEFKEQVTTLKNAAKAIFDRIDEERKRVEAEQFAKKLQEELERLAKLNETTAANETMANTTTIPEIELPEPEHSKKGGEENEQAENSNQSLEEQNESTTDNSEESMETPTDEL